MFKMYYFYIVKSLTFFFNSLTCLAFVDVPYIFIQNANNSKACCFIVYSTEARYV